MSDYYTKIIPADPFHRPGAERLQEAAACLLDRLAAMEVRTCIHNRMMQAGQGIFPPCKAKNRSNTWCIARFFNAAGREKTWPDGVRRL